MHGLGEYFWRFRGPEGTFNTYEGHFYANEMHGYGVRSYDDGRTFTVIGYLLIIIYIAISWHGTVELGVAWRRPLPCSGFKAEDDDNDNQVVTVVVVSCITSENSLLK